MAHPLRSFQPDWRNALFGSLSGTVVFGVIMSALGMMPMVSMILRLDVPTPSCPLARCVRYGYVAGITFDAFRANNPVEPVERVSDAGRVPA